MLPQVQPARQAGVRGLVADASGSALTRIGVGIDTSRYGHYAAFLGDDLQPAAGELQFAESAEGYGALRQRLEHICEHRQRVHLVVRLDAAGQYADNLLHFLQTLGATPREQAPRLANLAALAISCGDPQRNKNYRAALFGNQKSDPVEARAAARYALTERPASVAHLSLELRRLRQVAGRLQACVRHQTRLINQLHHLLALTFPELALLVKDLATGWVLELLHRFPTATLLAQASTNDLQNVPYLPHAQVAPLLDAARTSIASLDGAVLAELVREQIRQLRDTRARKKRLENLLVGAYRQLPTCNHLHTIPGIGEVTAAVLTAFILDIDRFATPGRLVKYFGALPNEVASAVDRDGNPRGPKRYVMSKRGNDLVRRYLWMAALSAVRFNPAVRALYARVVAKHPQRKAIAIGHAMRKLLHLAFAIWKCGKSFDPEHYDWDQPRHVQQESGIRSQESAAISDRDVSAKEQAAGLRSGSDPVRKEVTTACPITSTPADTSVDAALREANGLAIDFAHLKKQLPLARVLDQLGLTSRLKGSGPQRRGPCPIHRGDGRGRTFSVNLDQNVFCCHDAACQAKGDVLDLWAALHQLGLREAALDLVHSFALEPAANTRTEKRHG